VGKELKNTETRLGRKRRGRVLFVGKVGGGRKLSPKEGRKKMGAA